MPPETDDVAEQIVWQGRPSALVDLPFHLLLISGAVLATLGLLFILPGASVSVAERDVTARVFQWIIAGVWVLVVFLVLARAIARRATRYILTSERLRVTSGILSTTTEDLELRRVRDTGVTRPFLLRMLGLGDVRILSADPSHPRVTLHAVREPDVLQGTIRKLTERLIRRHGVREIDVM
ncbi:MAG TPA: PH domain-containing protein [Gemmatimonadales bacterium]